jgi:hypothetical protein
VRPGTGLRSVDRRSSLTAMSTAADRFDAALRLCDDAISDARARGSVFAFAVASWLLGHVAYFRSSLGDAEADLRHSIEGANRTVSRPAFRIRSRGLHTY